MRISNGMRTAGKTAALLAMMIAVNAALSWVLEPLCSSSEEMWQNFHAMEQVTAVYTGTSQCLQGINPLTVDAVLAESDDTGAEWISYNMATNMQSLANSREAIAAAIEEYGISHAVLAVDHEILTGSRSENARADQSFWRGKALTEGSIRERLCDDLRFMTSDAFIGKPASLTYLMPWVYNRTSNIRLNIREKLSGTIVDNSGHRNSRGFQASSEQLDPAQEFISWDEAEQWDQEAESLQELNISRENEKELESIRDLCSGSGVELIVVILPYPNWLSIYRKDDIIRTDQQLQEIFGSAGYDFYDFNRLLPEYFNASGNEYYSDVGHMNEKGAERFSSFLGKFLQERAKGTEVDSWFQK